jgi:ribosomal protein S27AE
LLSCNGVVIVRVTCPNCNDVAVHASEVQVLRDPAGGRFRFHCPRCGVAAEKEAVGRVADMLLAAGAGAGEMEVPLPGTDAAGPDLPLPELSPADLGALRQDLNAPDWLDRLLA